ncbi:MAG: LacI family DNA-binding transcriptional regulator [Caldilineaceae bacterium]
MPTIRDIANKAGVSIKTVSRVLNNEPMVGEATFARVTSVMDELGYVPNILAQRLARGRSNVIGLLCHNATRAYIHDVLGGALESARPRGYGVVTILVDPHQPNAQHELLRMVGQQRVDGYLFTPPCDNMSPLLEQLHQRAVPFVRLTPRDRTLPLPHVSATDGQGAQRMTEHLLQLGHRRIGFVMGNPDHHATQDRLEGYIAALQAHGIKVDKGLICAGDWHFASGVAAGERLLALTPRPTAVFAGNDEMAAGVLQVAHRHGLHLPRELSVAGFDDVPLAAQVWPPLTTVRQPIQEVAKLATDLLIDTLEGKPPATVCFELPTELVLRESTCALTTAKSDN